MTSVDDGPSSSQSTEVVSSPTARVQPSNIIGMENQLDNVIHLVTPQGIPISLATGGAQSGNVLPMQTITLAPGNFALPVTLSAQQLVSIKPFKSSLFFMRHRQTLQNRIRRCRMWRLIMVSSVGLQNGLWSIKI